MIQHYDEKTGIGYTLQGTYYLSDLVLPSEKEKAHRDNMGTSGTHDTKTAPCGQISITADKRQG